MNTKAHWLTVEEINALPYTKHNPLQSVPNEYGGYFDPCPVKKYGEYYYFWDESWAYCYGPFSTEEECKTALTEYSATL